MSKRVLIVDDEPDVATYLAAILGTNGYETEVAHSVDEGNHHLDRSPPDLICLDIMMPKQSGITMYLRLKKDDNLRSIPVIIISGVGHQGGFDFRSYVPDESVPPPDCFLEKPVVIDELLAEASKLIGSVPGEKEHEKQH